jgi:site-specific DNA recombinase
MNELKAPVVVGYARVSLEIQESEGCSLQAQQERITNYCAARGWTLHEIVVEQGSGKDLAHRPKLRGILADANPRRKERPWDLLLVSRLDRLTRSLKDLTGIVSDLDRAKIAFASVNEALDTSGPSGRLFLHILGSLAQFEREQIGQRTKEALAHLRGQNRRISGRLPMGSRLSACGRYLEPDEREGAMIAAVAELAPGRTLRALSAELACRGYLARSGRALSPSTLHAIKNERAA